MAATTGQLGLVTPTQGTLSGTWGDTVNNGITEYINIAIAGTLTFTGDGAITLANTTGDASATNIGSTTAQYMIIRVTGTLTTAKVITAPSYSKIYMVENAATGGIVTFKASGQTGVSIAVGEECFVYFNGTDYVKVSSSLLTALTGTLSPANGGTGVANDAASTLTISGAYPTTLTVGASTSVTLPASGSLGYLNIPQNSQSTAYTTVLADAGTMIFHPASDANARTFTIAANGSVAYALGTVIQFVNMSASNVTIAINSDTLTWAQGGGTGSRTLAQYGVANCVKVGTTQWLLTGTNVT
jgi:hypothetical protein